MADVTFPVFSYRGGDVPPDPTLDVRVDGRLFGMLERLISPSRYEFCPSICAVVDGDFVDSSILRAIADKLDELNSVEGGA